LSRKTLTICFGIFSALASACAESDRKNEIGLLLGGTVTPALTTAGAGDIQVGWPHVSANLRTRN